MAKNFTKGRRVLDVGCGYGWFLAAAEERGFEATGIEPNEKVAEDARAAGLSVRLGWFPSALRPDESFDVIAFNDVIEHLPNPLEALEIARSHLAPGGIIVVSIPVSDGSFYQASRFLARLGWRAPFERMWQRGFPSPHTYYFTRRGFAGTAKRAGLAIVASWRKPSISIRCLWDRLNFGGEVKPAWALPVVWTMLVILFPIIQVLPADTADYILQSESSALEVGRMRGEQGHHAV